MIIIKFLTFSLKSITSQLLIFLNSIFFFIKNVERDIIQLCVAQQYINEVNNYHYYCIMSVFKKKKTKENRNLLTNRLISYNFNLDENTPPTLANLFEILFTEKLPSDRRASLRRRCKRTARQFRGYVNSSAARHDDCCII